MAQKIGYAAGTVERGGEWLTVWGSYYRSDLVYATQGEAEQRADKLRNDAPSQASRIAVRKVEALGGTAFRILPD